MYASEALAHTVRGMAILFFIYWTIDIYPLRKRSRMMWLCFILSLGMAVCYMKDIVFIFQSVSSNAYICDLISLIDLLCVPMACSFFLEVTKPHSTTPRSVVTMVAIQSVFVIAYLLYPIHAILILGFAAAFLITLLTLIGVVVYAVRYKRYITENYSYTEKLDVNWVVAVAIVYALLYFLYYVAFSEPTWNSETFFNAGCIILWTFAYMISVRHHVVEELADDTDKDLYPATPLTPKAATGSLAETATNYGFGEGSETERILIRAMEEDKLYLNHKLTIAELATIIGTNKTYLSQYFHEVKKMTFYDYINNYRANAACQLMSEMAEKGKRLNISEVATQSGFNSNATFYRYFAKMKGYAPATFYDREIARFGGGGGEM